MAMSNDQTPLNPENMRWRKASFAATILATFIFFGFIVFAMLSYYTGSGDMRGLVILFIPFAAMVAFFPALLGLYLRTRDYISCPASERSTPSSNLFYQFLFAGFLLFSLSFFRHPTYMLAIPIGVFLAAIVTTAAVLRSRKDRDAFPKWVALFNRGALPILAILVIGLGFSVKTYLRDYIPQRTLEYRLNEATRQGNLDRVQSLLADGADPDKSDRVHIGTALITAVRSRRQDIFDLVLAKSSKPGVYTSEGDSALTLAIGSDDAHMVGALLERGARLSSSRIREGDVNSILWSKHLTPYLGDLSEIFDPASSKPFIKNALARAADSGNVPLARLLIAKGYRVNFVYDGTGPRWNPLYSATIHNHVEMMQLLIDQGADIDALPFCTEAARRAQLNSVRFLNDQKLCVPGKYLDVKKSLEGLSFSHPQSIATLQFVIDNPVRVPCRPDHPRAY